MGLKVRIGLLFGALLLFSGNTYGQAGHSGCSNCPKKLELTAKEISCLIKQAPKLSSTKNSLSFFNLSHETCTGEKAQTIRLITGEHLKQGVMIDDMPHVSSSAKQLDDDEAFLEVENNEDDCFTSIRFYDSRPDKNEMFILVDSQTENIPESSHHNIKSLRGSISGICPTSHSVSRMPSVKTIAPKMYNVERKFLECISHANNLVLSQSKFPLWTVHLEESCLISPSP